MNLKPVNKLHADACRSVEQAFLPGRYQHDDDEEAKRINTLLVHDRRMRRVWAELGCYPKIEAFTLLVQCNTALTDFRAMPALSPSEHVKHYSRLERAARMLADAIEDDWRLFDRVGHPIYMTDDDAFADWFESILARRASSSNQSTTPADARWDRAQAIMMAFETANFTPSTAEILRHVANRARDVVLEGPPVGKPNKDTAARTFFITKLAAYFRFMTGSALESVVAKITSVVFNCKVGAGQVRAIVTKSARSST